MHAQRATLVTALLDASATQKTINFPVVSSGLKPKKLKQTQLPFVTTKSTKTQQERLREMVIKVLGMTIPNNHAKVYFAHPTPQVNAFGSTKNYSNYSDASI